MTGSCQVLFIQGGGEGTHDDWDDKLVDSLRRHLGDGYEVRYPRMPAEDDPSDAAWGASIRREMVTLEDGAIVVGHSVGATILVHALAEGTPEVRLGAIVLLAAPFVGAGGWPAAEFQLPVDLGARLPRGVPVHLVAIPQAQVHLLPGLDHQLGNDLGDVARIIRAPQLEPAPKSSR
jgi:predicted alpha/beta hydrolase family esterase